MTRAEFMENVGATFVDAMGHPVKPTPRYLAQKVQRGDLFVREGVYAVNPITMKPTDKLKSFAVTSDIS